MKHAASSGVMPEAGNFDSVDSSMACHGVFTYSTLYVVAIAVRVSCEILDYSVCSD